MKHFIQKMLVASSFCLVLQSIATAQIKKTEYYFDTDPGFGNGNTLTFFTAAKDTTFSFSAGINSLSNGIHRIFVRSYDSVGKSWSHSMPQMFFKQAVLSNPLVNITDAEYFFDTDPGVGLASAATVSSGTDINISFTTNISLLSSGIHRLFVRTKDANGRWSMTSSQLFYKDELNINTLANINKAEYFFDTDPGFGLGTDVPVTAGQDISFSFSGSIASLSDGVHRMFVRTRDVNGRWSYSVPQYFFKAPAPIISLANINKAEYFFDTDPGFGNGIAATVVPGADITFNISGNISALSNGIHRLFVRTQDANGFWSQATNQLFFKEQLPAPALANITKLEYFFDTDPGFGSGTSVAVTPGQDIVAFNFTSSIASLNTGLHKLFLRSEDADGKWSMTQNQLFYKENVASNPLVNITKMEYFIDADPGFGMATDVPLTGAQDIVAFNFSGNIAAVGNGLHRLYVRSRDANGRWSMSTNQLFFKEAVQNNVLVNVDKMEYFFDTDPGFGNGTNIPVTTGQDISFTYNPSVAPLSTSAFHRLFIRSRDVNGKWSMTTSQLFYLPAPVPPAPVRLTKLEYFIDNDPGFGLATNVPFARGLDVTINFSASISSLSNGIHYLAVRSQDSVGRWSHSSIQMFYREAVASPAFANITKAEYFIDNDPGFGVANNIPVTAGQDITFGFSGSLVGLSNGIHRLFVRTLDANGKWSITEPQLFYYEPAASAPLANIVKAEYFIDTDPGIGVATPISLTAGQDINIPFSAAISSLSNGMHRMLVRTQDANGKWSHSTPQLFFKEPLLTHTSGDLTKLEYFWDVDTGFGACTAVSVPANTVDLVGFTFTAIVPAGFTGSHYFYVRAKDDWGLTTVKEVIFPSTSLPVTLLDFRAQRDGKQVHLSWNVAQEQGLAKYVVERSADGKHFDSIGMRVATGAKDYELYDPNPIQGLNFYRLRQVENSGKIKYSATLTILFSEMASTLSVYPNPATDHFSINAATSLATVTLTDMNGKVVRKYSDVSGNYPLNGIASGVYIVQVLDQDGVVVMKPLVVK